MKEDLLILYQEVQNLIRKYENPLVVKVNQEGRYELWTNKKAVIEGRKMDGIHFASAVIQSHYVGFYFMPVYIKPELKEEIGLDLLKTLKGKSCFQFKKNDSEMMDQIEKILAIGFQFYQKQGWV